MCAHIVSTLQWRHHERDGDFKSATSPLFTQMFIQAQIKENIKAPRHWPLWGEFTGDRWIPSTKGQWRGKCFHLLTSSWSTLPKTYGSWATRMNIRLFSLYCGIWDFRHLIVLLLQSTGYQISFATRKSWTCVWNKGLVNTTYSQYVDVQSTLPIMRPDYRVYPANARNVATWVSEWIITKKWTKITEIYSYWIHTTNDNYTVYVRSVYRHVEWVAVVKLIGIAVLFVSAQNYHVYTNFPDSNVHRANMGPTWVLSAPGGPLVGSICIAIRVGLQGSCAPGRDITHRCSLYVWHTCLNFDVGEPEFKQATSRHDLRSKSTCYTSHVTSGRHTTMTQYKFQWLYLHLTASIVPVS